MLNDDGRMALERMRNALEAHLAEADALGAGLLGAKLSEVVAVIDGYIGVSLL